MLTWLIKGKSCVLLPLKENTKPVAEMGGIILGFKGGGIKVDTICEHGSLERQSLKAHCEAAEADQRMETLIQAPLL